ncbi:hypothetical protein JCM10207_008738 [Rhodosporidiobolus poonsookiae]
MASDEELRDMLAQDEAEVARLGAVLAASSNATRGTAQRAYDKAVQKKTKLEVEMDAQARKLYSAHSLGKDVPLSFRQQHHYRQTYTAHYSEVQRAF